jgi:hypothetical protein
MYESCRNYQLVESRVGLERSNTVRTLIGGLGNSGNSRVNENSGSRDNDNSSSNNNNTNNNTNPNNPNPNDPTTLTIRKRLLSS